MQVLDPGRQSRDLDRRDLLQRLRKTGPGNHIRRLTRKELEENHAHRIDVGRRSDLASTRLLRCHVLKRAHQLPLPDLVIRGEGDTEVDDLGFPSFVNQQIRRLEIPMNHPAAVPEGDPATSPDEEPNSILTAHAFVVGVFDDGPGAPDHLHRDVGRGTFRRFVHARFEELGDVGVRKLGERLDFEFESLHRSGSREAGKHQLHRHLSLGNRLPTQINGSHATRAEEFLDLKSFDRIRAGRKGRSTAASGVRPPPRRGRLRTNVRIETLHIVCQKRHLLTGGSSVRILDQGGGLLR